MYRLLQLPCSSLRGSELLLRCELCCILVAGEHALPLPALFVFQVYATTASLGLRVSGIASLSQLGGHGININFKLILTDNLSKLY